MFWCQRQSRSREDQGVVYLDTGWRISLSAVIKPVSGAGTMFGSVLSLIPQALSMFVCLIVSKLWPQEDPTWGQVGTSRDKHCDGMWTGGYVHHGGRSRLLWVVRTRAIYTRTAHVTWWGYFLPFPQHDFTLPGNLCPGRTFTNSWTSSF